MWVLWLLACGTEEGRPRSTPGDPVADLTPVDQPESGLTDLVGVFGPTPATLPQVLSELERDMPGDRAIEILTAAHLPGVKVMSRERSGHTVVQSMLEAHPSVGVTLILNEDASRLQQVDLSMPQSAAIVVLGEAWGDPGPPRFDDEGKAIHTWTGTAWTAELYDTGEKAVLKFR